MGSMQSTETTTLLILDARVACVHAIEFSFYSPYREGGGGGIVPWLCREKVVVPLILNKSC